MCCFAFIFFFFLSFCLFFPFSFPSFFFFFFFFLTRGLVHPYHLDEPIFNFRDFWFIFSLAPNYAQKLLQLNSVEPGQMPRFAASELGRYCTYLRNEYPIWKGLKYLRIRSLRRMVLEIGIRIRMICLDSDWFPFRQRVSIQYTFNGSNTDGSFTAAVSDSFWVSWKKSHSCRVKII